MNIKTAVQELLEKPEKGRTRVFENLSGFEGEFRDDELDIIDYNNINYNNYDDNFYTNNSFILSNNMEEDNTEDNELDYIEDYDHEYDKEVDNE